jgi:Mrp family chromosome partitioning ATPase/capsular polysaccharide biosynthesis protein
MNPTYSDFDPLESHAHGDSHSNGSAAPVLPAEPSVSGKGQPSAKLPPALASSPTFILLFRALQRRWLLALTCGLLCMALAVGLTWGLMSPARYQGRTLLHVYAKAPSIAFPNQDARQDFISFQKTQVALAKSRLVLSNALNQPKVAELSIIKEIDQSQLEPVEWLEKEVQVDFTVGPEILRIAVNGDKPEELVVLVNALRESYLQKIVNWERSERLKKIEQQGDVLNKYEEDLRRKEKELRSLAKLVGSSDSKAGALRQQMTVEQLTTARRELRKTESDRRALEIRLKDQQGKLANFTDQDVPEALIEEYLDQDPQLEPARLEMARLQKDLAQARQVAAGGIVEKYQKLLDTAEDKYKKARKEQRDKVIARVRDAAKLKAQALVGELQDQAQLHRKLEDTLRTEVQTLEEQAEKLTYGSLDLQMRGRELERMETLVKNVGDQKEALQVELMAPGRVQVLEEAIVTQTHNEKKRLLLVVVTGLCGLGIVLFGFSWFEFRARRVGSVDDVVQGLGMNFVGTLPELAGAAGTLAYQGSRGTTLQHQLVESIDAARTMLLYAGRKEDLRVLMVSSATSGEGKTSLASHLAASFARAHHRTLLVDADLRQPAIHRVFNLPIAPGLSELLRDEVDISEVLQMTPASEHLYGQSSRTDIKFTDVIQPTSVSGLCVMPAGKLSGHAIQALASDNFRTMFDQLKEQFDTIIVDSCPILPVTDTLLIGQHVDGVILAVRRDVSRLPLVYAAYQRLTALGIRVVGTVVNGVPGESYGSEYLSASATAKSAS